MATKPKEVPCEEVIDWVDDLQAWLIGRKLAKRSDGALATSFNVLAKYPDESTLEHVVARCIYDLEMFLAAARRRDSEIRAPHLEPLSDEEQSLLFDDGPEVETDKAIRAFDPKLAHLERLIRRIAIRKVQRAKLKGVDAKVMSDTLLETKFFASRAIEQIELVRRKLALVGEAIQTMCPALPDDEVTLSGWRKLERSVRKRLRAAGYEAATPERSR